jgi:hypothetical protein
MNSYNISDAEKLRMLFEQAFSSAENAGDASNYDEYIALIAQGRIDLLPESIRQQVLDKIAYDPDSAELLNGLSGVLKAKGSNNNSGNFRTMSITWAMAATLMVGLFVWRAVVPPQAGYSFRQVTPYSTKGIGNEYWDQAQQRRAVMDANSSRWRDYALLGSVSVTCILSLVILTDRLRRKRE